MGFYILVKQTFHGNKLRSAITIYITSAASSIIFYHLLSSLLNEASRGFTENWKMIARKKQMRQLQFAIIAKHAFAIFSLSVSSLHQLLEFAFIYSANNLRFVKFSQNGNYF